MQENDSDWNKLSGTIKRWGLELGFSAVGITHPDLSSSATSKLMRWLKLGHHGEMDYMAKHAEQRTRPEVLLPGTVSIITAHLPYWPKAATSEHILANKTLGYVSRYALGRDYHKTMRLRLQKLADLIGCAVKSGGENQHFQHFACRVFSDSAPVMEIELARQADIAWRGKNTLALTRQGSWYFLGEIYTNLPLPPDPPTNGQREHCGICTHCLEACPTGAILAPYEIDARRCISYLTIELKGSIPVELRPLIGNRIYGCDDCQLCCPWNRFARHGISDFSVRNRLDDRQLTELFAWDEEKFNACLAGSPIRRIGHERWLRNIAVALGNAPHSPDVVAALKSRQGHPSALIREHVDWALARHS